MKRLALSVAAITLASGCLVRPPYDATTACRAARASYPQLQRGGLSSKELAEVVAPDERAFRHAKSAYDQSIVWTAMTAVGAGLLLSGLVMGFVVDPTKTDARNAGYGLTGAAIGVGAIATTIGFTAPRSTRSAIRLFSEFAETCRDNPVVPTELPPPGTPARIVPPPATGGVQPTTPPSGPAEAAPGPPKGEVYVPPTPPQ